jgi:hypothetical protein
MDINKQIIANSKLSRLLPIMQQIAKEWGLKLQFQRDWDIAKRIMVNSVKNN